MSIGRKKTIRQILEKASDRRIFLLFTLLLLAVYISDLFTPLGFAHGSLYVPLIFLSLSARRRRILAYAAAASAVLTVLGIFTAPPAPEGFPFRYVIINRIVSLTVIGIAYVLSAETLRYFKRQQTIQEELRRTSQQAKEGEAYYRGMINSLHEDIFVIDRDRRITDVNNSFLKTLGRSRQEVIGEYCYAVSHGYSCPCSQMGGFCLLDQVFASGESAGYQHVHRHADGSEITVDILLFPIISAEGKVTHVVEAARDITELVKGRQELQKNVELLKIAGRIARFGGWLYDQSEGTVVFSDEAAGIFGMTEGSYEQMLQVFSDEHLHHAHRCIQDCIGTERVFNEEFEITPAAGERVWINMAGEPWYDDAGVLKGVQGGLQDISDKREITASLQEREMQFQTLVEGSPIAIFVQTDGKISYLNSSACRLFGADSPEQLLGAATHLRFHPEVRVDYNDRIALLHEEQQRVAEIEEVCITLDGAEVSVEISAVPIVYLGMQSTLIFASDITERKEAQRTQEQLRSQLEHAQRLDTIGSLAGGVAHDYNNMLGVILGYAELAQKRVNSNDPVSSDLKEIISAANRSSTITGQLLAFARRQTAEPETVDLNKSIAHTLSMLKRLVGEDISLTWNPGKNLPTILIDPSQLDQILINLAINARDAVDTKEGSITITTERVVLDENSSLLLSDMEPGVYCRITVADNGCGMDAQTLSKVFEPFFTTKQEGSGLGLSMIYGIVRQNCGAVHIESSPGTGTLCSIYFPEHEGTIVEMIKPEKTEQRTSAGELVLVVEDEQSILMLITTLMKRLGYQVISVDSPKEALEIGKQQGKALDLLITDVVMPDVTGKELSQQLNEFCPNMKTLYMSGYTADVITHKGVLDRGVNFIQKPFSLNQLSEKVQQVLHSSESENKNAGSRT